MSSNDLARRLAEAALMYLDTRGELAPSTLAAYGALEHALAQHLARVLRPAEPPSDPRYEHGLGR